MEWGKGVGGPPSSLEAFLYSWERERGWWGERRERERTLNISTDHKLFVTREKAPDFWFSEPIKCPRIWPLKRVLLVGNVPRGAGWGRGGQGAGAGAGSCPLLAGSVQSLSLQKRKSSCWERGNNLQRGRNLQRIGGDVRTWTLIFRALSTVIYCV